MSLLFHRFGIIVVSLQLEPPIIQNPTSVDYTVSVGNAT